MALPSTLPRSGRLACGTAHTILGSELTISRDLHLCLRVDNTVAAERYNRKIIMNEEAAEPKV